MIGTNEYMATILEDLNHIVINIDARPIAIFRTKMTRICHDRMFLGISDKLRNIYD